VAENRFIFKRKDRIYILLLLFFMPIFLSSSVTISSAAEKVILNVALIEKGRPPYFWKTGDKFQGLYIDLLNQIKKETELEFHYIFLPQNRLRQAMVSGNADLEPGIDREWRQLDKEDNNSIYSIPFMISEEVWVYASASALARDKKRSLEGLTPCNIRGFNLLPDQEIATSKIVTNSDETALRLLEIGRCDYTLMPVGVLQYLSMKLDKNFTISKPHHRYQLRLRLHRKHAHLLPLIDGAINKIIKSGYMNSLQKKYR